MISLLVTVWSHVLFALALTTNPTHPPRIAVMWDVTNQVGSPACVHYVACVSVNDMRGCTDPEPCH